MTDTSLFGNRIQPLRNVAAMVQLEARLQSRALGLPKMAVFHGWPGYGKTFACTHLAAAHDAIHLEIDELWTKSTLLEEILRELSVHPQRTRARMGMQVRDHLGDAGRTLIIDEADYAVEKGMIPLIRDIHDKAQCPVILVGMEELPQKLKKWPLVDSRIGSWVAAQPADLQDARRLASVYCPDVKLDDALLERIVSTNKGNCRRISDDLDHVREECQIQGVDRMTAAEWGDAPFLRGDAPSPRRLAQ